jgi:hypothetical protein
VTEGNRVRIGNRAQDILGFNMDGFIEEWIKLHNEELHKLYILAYITIIKIKRDGSDM